MAKAAEVTVGVIYLVTNRINGKVYAGQTTQDLNERFRQHGEKRNCVINFAFKKYGINAFSIHPLVYAPVGLTLDKLEIYYISFFNSTNQNLGYNIAFGGSGVGKHSKKTKIKMSQAAKLRLTDKTKHPNFGRNWDDRFKEKLRIANLGKKYSVETNFKKASFGPNNGRYTHLTGEQISFILEAYSSGKSFYWMRKNFFSRFGKTIFDRKLKKVAGGDF